LFIDGLNSMNLRYSRPYLWFCLYFEL
jgi:hypothetical protein